jgi:hypothetical protein
MAAPQAGCDFAHIVAQRNLITCKFVILPPIRLASRPMPVDLFMSLLGLKCARFPSTQWLHVAGLHYIEFDVDKIETTFWEVGYWGATGQKSSIRKMSSDFLEDVECVPQMVVFDVVPQDFNVLKQSAIQGNTGVWQLNFSRPSNAVPMVALMANRQPINRRATFTSMIPIGRLLRSTAEITTV